MLDNDGLTEMEARHAKAVRTRQQEACDAHLDDLAREYVMPVASGQTDGGFVPRRIPFNPRLSLTGSPGFLCEEKVL